MAKLTESTLRRIIKEELLEMMDTISTQSEVMQEPPPVYPLSVSVQPSPNQDKDAIQKAIQRATGEYPGYKFDLKTGGRYGVGYMVRRSPNSMGDNIVYTVYLKPSKSSEYALDEADKSGLKSKVMSAVKGKSGGMSVAALAKRLGVSEKEIKGVSRSGGLELVGDKVQAYQEAGDEEDDE